MDTKKIISKLSVLLMLATAVIFGSCNGDLEDDISALENRVAEIESSVSKLQETINNGGVVTSVVPTADGDGITIYFSGSLSDPITITNGTNADPLTIVDIDDSNDAYTEIFFSDDTSVKIPNGEKGDEGEKGEKGDEGDDGVTITSITEKDGETTILFSDGKSAVINDGDSVTVSSSTTDVDGNTVITFSNGEEVTVYKGDAGADLTVGSITFRDMGDYGLFFFDAIDEDQPRIIYVPMDVQTPTSLTLLTDELGAYQIGDKQTFDVVVNPTANAKPIEKFYLVEMSYGTRASVYGDEVAGLEVSAEEGTNGKYTLTVECTGAVQLTAGTKIFVAAEYNVDTFTGGSTTSEGYIDATTYKTYKESTTYAEYNKEEAYELLSATSLSDPTFDYAGLSLSDVTAAQPSDITMYENSDKTFDIAESLLTNVNYKSVAFNSVLSSGDNKSLTISESNGEVTVESPDGYTGVTVYTVTMSVTDMNGDTTDKDDNVTALETTFNVTVYPYADEVSYTVLSTYDWLPAEKNFDIVGNASFSSDYNADYNYFFDEANDLSFTVTFVDTYNISSLYSDYDFEDASKFDATKLVKDVTYTSGSDAVSYTLCDNEEAGLLLQPGTYTIAITGRMRHNALNADDFADGSVTVTQSILIKAPEVNFALDVTTVEADLTDATKGIYAVNDWNTFDVDDLTNSDLTVTAVDGRVYAFNNDTSVDNNMVELKGVRSMVDDDKTNVVTFPATYDKEFAPVITFYYELTTGVKFPIQITDTNNSNAKYSTIEIDFNEVTMVSIDASVAHNDGASVTIANNVITLSYEAYINAGSATQKITNSATVTQDGTAIASSIFSDLYTANYPAYTYEQGALMYDDGTGVLTENLPLSPLADGKETLMYINASGKITVNIAKNLLWDVVPADASFQQTVTVKATDFYGNAMDSNVITLKIVK